MGTAGVSRLVGARELSARVSESYCARPTIEPQALRSQRASTKTSSHYGPWSLNPGIPTRMLSPSALSFHLGAACATCWTIPTIPCYPMLWRVRTEKFRNLQNQSRTPCEIETQVRTRRIRACGCWSGARQAECNVTRRRQYVMLRRIGCVVFSYLYSCLESIKSGCD